MKKSSLFLFFLLVANSIFAQLIFNASHHNFGEVDKQDAKYFDFTLTNAGKEEAKIQSVKEPYGVSVKFSSKTIQPDSTIIVRIKYTPKRKGSFKADVPVFVSNQIQPITFTLEGIAKTVNLQESIESPDFISAKKQEDAKTEITLKVIDINTKTPINNAIVEIIWDGLIYKQLFTNREGEAHQILKIDGYYFVVNADGYGTEERAIDINPENNTLEFLMGEPKLEELIVEKIDTITDPILIPEPKDTISTAEMPVTLYAQNNIVLLIDVSISMNQDGRLDLLKAAMIELLNGLRSIDKLAIITYSSSVEVVLTSQYVRDKAQISKIIQNLKAGGGTSGSKGLKTAYQVAVENKILGGNNLIVLVTDGAFNISRSDKVKIEQQATNGVRISVVGMRNERDTEKSMKSVAELGAGNYINVKSYSQAKERLLKEVKEKSKKN